MGCRKGEYGPDPRIEEMRARGEALFAGRGGCIECHSFGDVGGKVRGPNLADGERRTAAYIAASVIDPDAKVYQGFVRGVMKPPDLPPVSLTDDDIIGLALYISGEDDIDGARAAIAPARAVREERARRSAVDAEVRRVAFRVGDPKRGAELFEAFGCGLCHGNERNPDIKAPDLAASGKRLSKDDLARWLIAPPQTRMPSYRLHAQPQDIADLCEYIESLVSQRE